MVAAIEQIHAEVKGRYGSPRMTAELNARGHACTVNTVADVMKAHGIRAIQIRDRSAGELTTATVTEDQRVWLNDRA